MSPTSPLTIGLSYNPTTAPGTSGQTGTGGRRTYRGSKSVSNTPLLRGQRSRMNSITRAQANTHANANTGNPNFNNNYLTSPHNSSTNNSNTPSSTMGTGMLMETVVGDTPSPVDLDLSMPPPAPPEHSNSNVGAGPNYGPNLVANGSDGGQLLAKFGLGLGEERLLPVTPASIMKLGRLGTNTIQYPGSGHNQGAAEMGKDEDMGVGRTKDNGKEREKEQGERDRVEKEKEKEKSKGGSGNTTNSGVAGRTRKSLAAAAGGSGQGLKAILPANVLDPNLVPASNASTSASQQQPRKTSHKAAEQKRRDSLKSTFDDLRTLLPPIPLPSDIDDAANTGVPGIPGAWPPRSSSLLPGSLPPRGPPKTGAEGPNKGVSKLQLLICGNEYIRVLKSRVERRDEEIGRLRREVRRLRGVTRSMRVDEDGPGMGGGDVEMVDPGLGLGMDFDFDLERDLDAIEGMRGGSDKGMEPGIGVGSNVSRLGSVGEQDEDDEVTGGD